MSILILVENVGKDYSTILGQSVTAISNISFSLEAGKFLSIVGPSGSGKSTLLNLLAGVEVLTSGNITINSLSKTNKLGYVLQENALFPWYTVKENLVYALSLKGVDFKEKNSVAKDLCDQLSLPSQKFLHKYPKELSGGERRRVAIGMALALKPDILLLDEPSSQLDYNAKWDIQNLIQKIGQHRRLTVVCVTHDLEEAVFLGDKVLVLNRGTVSNLVHVDLLRPRDNDIRLSGEFNSYRRLLMEG